MVRLVLRSDRSVNSPEGLRVLLQRERVSHEQKVWVAQLLEHDFAVQVAPNLGPNDAIDALIDHLDTHQLLCLRDDASNPVERVVCAPPESFDRWERAAPHTYYREEKRERVHEEGKPNPFPMWRFNIRLESFHTCGSFNAFEDMGGCCVVPEVQGIVHGLCAREAFVLFRHPTEPKGHYRCLAHAVQDHVVFEQAGWLTEKI